MIDIPPAGARLVLSYDFDLHTIAGVRQVILAGAGGYGLVEPYLSDFVLAVNEVAANAVRHGGGRGRLRLWQGLACLICEVADPGAGTDRAAERAGRRMDVGALPIPTAESGRGLWLARRLCDSVAVATAAASTRVVLTYSAHLRTQ